MVRSQWSNCGEMTLKGIRCHMWAGQDKITKVIAIKAYSQGFTCINSFTQQSYGIATVVIPILSLQKHKHRAVERLAPSSDGLKFAKLIAKHQAIGSRVCFPNSYLFGRGSQVSPYIIMPLDHAQVNETSFLKAWTKFTLRKYRYGFPSTRRVPTR